MTLESELAAALTPYLRSMEAALTHELEGEMAKIYIDGSTQMMSWGKTKGGLPIAFEGPPVKEAIAYAKDHCGTMVTKMTVESQRQIANTVAEAIRGKRGIEGMQRDIRATMERMRVGDPTRKGIPRARMIARTESNDALSQSFLDNGNAMEVPYKEWIVFDPCTKCDPNEGDIVPFNDIFSTGHERPPIHPSCNCAMAPALAPKGGRMPRGGPSKGPTIPTYPGLPKGAGTPIKPIKKTPTVEPEEAYDYKGAK